jgi:hypothetical protein
MSHYELCVLDFATGQWRDGKRHIPPSWPLGQNARIGDVNLWYSSAFTSQSGNERQRRCFSLKTALAELAHLVLA